VAVSEFEALCGFREPKLAAGLIEALAVPRLDPVVALLRGGDLRAAVAALLDWPEQERADLVKAVATAAGRRSGDDAYGVVVRLAGHYPDDVGVVVTLLLNHVRLRPGEAIWMPAGNLHAYLRGAGVEVMATSDNVLRGGLTPKRVDVPELLRVLRFTPLTDPLVRREEVAPGVVSWPVPAAEFRLFRADLGGDVPAVELRLAGPRTVFCLDGDVVADDGSPVVLPARAAAFGPAGRLLRLTGNGTTINATTKQYRAVRRG
jgi:mannose-6-phosphate isomerase